MRVSILAVIGLVLLVDFSAVGQIKKSLSAGKKAPAAKAAPEPAPAITVPAWLLPDAPYQPAAPQLTDLVDTKLDVRFDYQHQYLLGTATLTAQPHFYPQNKLVLDAKGFDIKSVQLLSQQKPRPLLYTYNGRQLVVNLDRAYPHDQRYQVRVAYVAKPNELPAGGSEAITSDKGLYFINPLGQEPNKPRQIWTQGETQSNSCWFPTIDHPNQKMTQEISLTVESQFKTLSNGLLVSQRKNSDGTRTDTWRQSLPAAPYLTMLAVGNWAVVPDTWRGKAVDYYVEPQYAATAQQIFGHTPAMLEFFSQKLGVDFPWEKYAQVAVRDYVSGAMENTTATVHGAAIQGTRRELLDMPYETSESVIAHELFHHWFGDLVTCEAWSNLPLNESFANYAQYLWAEHQYGPDLAALVQQQNLNHYLEEAELKRVPLIRTHYDNREDMFDRHSYEKGGRVLHLLRQQVGDEAFFASLQRYLIDNKYQAVEVSRLRVAFEQTTGEDLGWFFDQWFMQRGHPELKITHAYAAGQVRLRVQQVQDTVFQPVFRLPVTVTVWEHDQPTDHQILVTKTDQTFLLAASSQPQLVKFDNAGVLLAQLDEQRSQDELLYQFYHARGYLQKAEALDELQNRTTDFAVSGMLRNALQDKFFAVRRLALEHLRGYRGPTANTVRAEIQAIATADPSSAVRAQAVLTLASFPTENFLATYQTALRDSSYLVEASAVAALAKVPGNAAMRPQLAALDDTPNTGLVVALASYYAQRGTIDQYAWYLRRLPDLPDGDLYAYLPAFGTFMAQMPLIERERGLAKLEDLARHHGSYLVRLGAYHGLTNLVSTQPELKSKLLDIKTKETDERLKAFYNLM